MKQGHLGGGEGWGGRTKSVLTFDHSLTDVKKTILQLIAQYTHMCVQLIVIIVIIVVGIWCAPPLPALQGAVCALLISWGGACVCFCLTAPARAQKGTVADRQRSEPKPGRTKSGDCSGART